MRYSSQFLRRYMLWTLLAVGLLYVARLNAQQAVDPAVEQRVAALIAVLSHPEAAGENLQDTRDAIYQLGKIGPSAAPQLVRAIVSNKDGSSVAAYSANALDRIGNPAVESVRKLWEPMSDHDRWRLMRFRGNFDYGPALQFAIQSLESNDEQVRRHAIEFLGKHRETIARVKLLDMLNSETPGLRWVVLNALRQIQGDQVVDAFIPLLAGSSWVAKGEGATPPPGYPPLWWPDGRATVISALRELKAAKSAAAMLTLMREKGPGKGYMAEVIIPALVEFNYRESIEELRLLAGADPSEVLAYQFLKGRAQHEAREAIRKLEGLRD